MKNIVQVKTKGLRKMREHFHLERVRKIFSKTQSSTSNNQELKIEMFIKNLYNPPLPFLPFPSIEQTSLTEVPTV